MLKLYCICLYLLSRVSVGVAPFFVCLGFEALAANCPLPPYFMPNKPLPRPENQVSGKYNLAQEIKNNKLKPCDTSKGYISKTSNYDKKNEEI